MCSCASNGIGRQSIVTYNTASLATQVNYGSGDSDNFAYDSNTLRMTQFKFNVGAPAQSYVGTLTWNANSTLIGARYFGSIMGRFTRRVEH